MSNLAEVKKDTCDLVLARINEFEKKGELHFPKNYSPENALKSAWLLLQSIETKDNKGNKVPALSYCTRDSIANSLLDMVVQGLSPAKKQCYFIPYKNSLQLHRSYFGTMAATKRTCSVKEINAQIVYAGEKFEYGYVNGRMVIKEHIPDIDNCDDATKAKYAYCVIIDCNDVPHAFVMSIKKIFQAWKQSKADPIDAAGNVKTESVHGKFFDQMAKKTVINNACKYFLNTSDDSDLIIDAINRTTENENSPETVEDQVSSEVAQNQASEVVDFEEAEEIEEKEETADAPKSSAPF